MLSKSDSIFCKLSFLTKTVKNVSIQVEIQKVIDGDTYVVDIDLGLSVWVRGERIRLYGVNTPEIYGVKCEKRFGRISFRKSGFQFCQITGKKRDTWYH